MRELRLGFYTVIGLLFLQIGQVQGDYILTDLDKDSGGQSEAYAINNSGQVVGRILYSGFSWRAGKYEPTARKFISLGTSGAKNSWAWDINDGGIIVGEEDDAGSKTQAMVYDGNNPGNNTCLGDLGGNESRALGINNNNIIVGQARDSSSNLRATKFDFTGSGANTPLSNGINDKALAVNDTGMIVGEIDISGRPQAAIFGTVVHDLGLLANGEAGSRAANLNDAGDIIGHATNSGSFHAVKFDRTVPPKNKDLGTLGGPASMAYAINDDGNIVGQAMALNLNGDYEFHATLFDGNKNIDLNEAVENWGDFSNGPKFTLACARDINNRGQIVGYMTAPGITHAFLLTHCPEPSSLLSIIGMGLSFFVFTKRNL